MSDKTDIRFFKPIPVKYEWVTLFSTFKIRCSILYKYVKMIFSNISYDSDIGDCHGRK